MDVDQVNALVKGEDIGIPLVKDEPKSEPKKESEDSTSEESEDGGSATDPVIA